MKSLSHQIDEKLAGAAAARRRQRSTKADPRDAHEAGERAQRIEAEVQQLVMEREDDVTMARGIRNSLAAFEKLPLETETRRMARHYLRLAALLLEEEAGPAPEKNIPARPPKKGGEA